MRNTNTGEVTFAGSDMYGLTSSTDTHMVKNTEWGMVAYLSQSKYGKNGNTNYNKKEIFINNSSFSYTGRSGGAQGGSTPINGTYPDQTSTTQYNQYGFYTYDDYLLGYNTNNKSIKVKDKGTGASTTGTIYGIYDMSGGSNEYVMANWFGTQYTGFGNSSGFTTSNYPGGNNGSKYYEAYRGSTSSTEMESSKAIKGDATWETMKWYTDNAGFVSEGLSWFYRGGKSSLTDKSGIYAVVGNNGKGYFDRAFRSILIP